MHQYSDTQTARQVEVVKVVRTGERRRNACVFIKSCANCKSHFPAHFQSQRNLAQTLSHSPFSLWKPHGIIFFAAWSETFMPPRGTERCHLHIATSSHIRIHTFISTVSIFAATPPSAVPSPYCYMDTYLCHIQIDCSVNANQTTDALSEETFNRQHSHANNAQGHLSLAWCRWLRCGKAGWSGRMVTGPLCKHTERINTYGDKHTDFCFQNSLQMKLSCRHDEDVFSGVDIPSIYSHARWQLVTGGNSGLCCCVPNCHMPHLLSAINSPCFQQSFKKNPSCKLSLHFSSFATSLLGKHSFDDPGKEYTSQYHWWMH